MKIFHILVDRFVLYTNRWKFFIFKLNFHLFVGDFFCLLVGKSFLSTSMYKLLRDKHFNLCTSVGASPNLHFHTLPRTKIYRWPNLPGTQIYTSPNLPETQIYTTSNLPATQIYTKNLHNTRFAQTQIYTNTKFTQAPNLHKPNFTQKPHLHMNEPTEIVHSWK